MAEIYFYHLEGVAAEDVLLDLLQRGLKRNLRMSVEISDLDRLSLLSERLWSIEDVAFVPHGLGNEPFPERQPIWLSQTADNPNHSQYRFYAGGALPPTDTSYDRASVLLDGDDAAKMQAARQLWRAAKAQGCNVKYWKKDEGGRWMDMAGQNNG